MLPDPLDTEIAAAEEERLDARYGIAEPEGAPPWPPEPERLPATPQEALAASFNDAIRFDLAVQDHRQQGGVWTLPASFDAAIRPAIIAVEQTGETWFGARLWQKAAELYAHGMEMIADLGREAFGYWQSFVRDRDPARDGDGPER